MHKQTKHWKILLWDVGLGAVFCSRHDLQRTDDDDDDDAYDDTCMWLSYLEEQSSGDDVSCEDNTKT